MYEFILGLPPGYTKRNKNSRVQELKMGEMAHVSIPTEFASVGSLYMIGNIVIITAGLISNRTFADIFWAEGIFLSTFIIFIIIIYLIKDVRA